MVALGYGGMQSTKIHCTAQ